MEDLVSLYHDMIVATLSTLQVSDKMMHVHVGLAIYVLAQLVLRTRRASLDALTIVFAAEALNETMDRLHTGSLNWGDTLSDFALTMFWPVILVVVGRFRRQRWRHAEKQRAAIRGLMVGKRGPRLNPAPAPRRR